jgi:hypothetical protein
LARNKVLDRIQPQAVDLATEAIRALAKQQIESMDANAPSNATIENYVNLDFPSRIKGKSFKVIPIAIYI